MLPAGARMQEGAALRVGVGRGGEVVVQQRVCEPPAAVSLGLLQKAHYLKGGRAPICGVFF